MNVEYRISYNPFTKKYISGYASHSEQIYNKGEQKQFKDYIRCIVLGSTLYLRLYYPFDNLDTLTRDRLNQASYTLLNDNKDEILTAIKKHDNIDIQEIKYNVDNDLLKGLQLANI